MTTAEITAMNGEVTQYDTDVTAQVAAQAAARSATATKTASRKKVEDGLRKLRSRSKAHGTPDDKVASLGIPSSSSPSPATATRPDAKVSTSERLRHTIDWTDEATPDNRKKPRGAMGAEIWVKIDGAPPTDDSQCVFLTLDAFTPYLATFDGSQAGKMAHYMLRWRMRDGTTGAWSETVSATITG
jgi:hypothetical protein